MRYAGFLLLSALGACDRVTDAAPPTISKAPILTGRLDGAGLSLNQVLRTSGLAADRVTIAVRGVRPSIAATRTGYIAAFFFEGAAEDIAVSTSSDGHFWTPARRIFGGTDPYIVRLKSGRLLLSYATEDLGGRIAGSHMATSDDDGATWNTQTLLPSLFPVEGKRWSAHGMVELASGDVLAFVPVYAGTTFATYTLRSHDGGTTWGAGVPTFTNADEVSVIQLPGGRLLATVRVDGIAAGYAARSTDFQPLTDTGYPADMVMLTTSDDEGKTWAPLRDILPPSAVPAHLLHLHDGRILLTYGVRFMPRGVQAILSSDKGQTWDFANRYILAWDGQDVNVGYPWSVVDPDGAVLTAYYTRPVLGPTAPNSTGGITAQLVRWRP
jgi:hypothetical protein